jgi:hypothetical protein
MRDRRGLEVTAASADAVAHLDEAVAAYCGLRLDTGDHLKAALAADPDLLLGHVLKGDFLMLFGKRDFVRRAAHGLAAAEATAARRGATPREAAHLDALRAWVAGDLAGAVARWEAVLADDPRDLAAAKLAQYGRFYLGDSAAMRDSLGRILPAWDEAVPGYGFLLGCHAFGLEESGDYAGAERAGRRAVEINGEDVWAAHAVAHVMEMQNRPHEGIAWVDGLDHEWGAVNNFVFHIRWHRCLFHLDLERYDRVLDLYDREVRAESTDDYLDISNAVALLWRLEQAGVEVGDRWSELGERSAPLLEDHVLVFADLHYLMAAAACGDSAGIERWQRSSSAYAERHDETEAGVMREVGLALGVAALAHRAGDWRAAVERLLPLRPAIGRIGGSHAQRDLFDEMLIDAALHADPGLARRLVAERLAQRPRNVWAWRQAAAVALAFSDKAAAQRARETARGLLNA